MKTRKKKGPNDYPLMAFRVSDEEKEELSALIDQIVDSRNANLKDDEFKVRKNDVFVEGLRAGLRQLKKKQGG